MSSCGIVAICRKKYLNDFACFSHTPVPATQSFVCTRLCDFSQNLVSLMEVRLDGLGVSNPNPDETRRVGASNGTLGSLTNDSLWRRGTGKSHVVETVLSLEETGTRSDNGIRLDA